MKREKCHVREMRRELLMVERIRKEEKTLQLLESLAVIR